MGRNRWATLVSALVLLGASGTHAEESPPSRATKLAKAALEVRTRDPMLCLLLARDAFEQEPNVHTRSALYDALVSAYEQAAFLGHRGPLTAVDLSADEQLVLTASEDGSARVWTRSGEPRRVLAGTQPVLDALFLPTGDVLTVSKDKGDAVELEVWSDLDPTSLAKGIPPDAYQVSRKRDRILINAGDEWTLWSAKGKKSKSLSALQAQFSPSGQVVAFQDEKGWALLGPKSSATTRLKDSALASRVVFDPAADRVVALERSDATVYDFKGKVLARLPHQAPIEAAAISAKNGEILTASGPSFRVWSPEGEQRFELPKNGTANHVFISKDGGMACALTKGKDITMWSTSRWEPYSKTTLAKDATHLHTDNTAGWTTAFHEDGTYSFFDIDMRQRHPFGDARTISITKWDPRQRWNLNGTDDGRMSLINLESRNPIALHGHSKPVVDACFSLRERMVVTASADGTARMWALKQRGSPVLGRHSGSVYGGWFASDDRVVTFSSSDWAIWDVGTGRRIAHKSFRRRVAWWAHAQDRFAVVCEGETIARPFDVKGTALPKLDHDGEVNGVEFSVKGDKVLTWSKRGKDMRIFNKKGKLVGALTHDKPILGACFGRTNDRIVTIGPSKTVRVYTSRGKVKSEWRLPESAARVLTVDEGKIIVTPTRDQKHIRFFDERGKEQAHIESEGLTSLAYDAATKRVVTGSNDKTAKLWAFDGTLLASMDVNVTHVSFLPGGKRLATAAGNQVHLWDLQGKLLATLRSHWEPVAYVCHAPDGAWLLSCGKDRTARIWPATDDALAEVARSRSTRALTADEQDKYKDLLNR